MCLNGRIVLDAACRRSRRLTGPAVLAALLIHNAGAAAPDLHTSGLFTRAEVTGPDSTFITQVMSDPDGLTLTQHDNEEIKLVAGFDPQGTWLFDPSTGEVRALDDKWQVFLVGHDLHRLWLAPQTRWIGAGRHFIDTAGRQARFGRVRDGRPGRLDLQDEQGEPIRIEFSRADDSGLFREAVFETGGGDYVYSFATANVIAPEQDIGEWDTAARIELQRLHRLYRMAHLAELPALLATSPDPLLEISSGTVTEVTPDELRDRFTRYFEAVDFLDWHDRAAPVLVIGDDRTLASKAVQMTVVLDAPGGAQTQEFAWLETWRRRDGVWRLIAIASTQAQ